MLQAVCYRIDLNDAIRLIYLCIVYTFSKIFFTCNYPKIKQPYVVGIMTKESCLIYCTMKAFNLDLILKNAILLGFWAECLASHSDIDFWLS